MLKEKRRIRFEPGIPCQKPGRLAAVFFYIFSKYLLDERSGIVYCSRGLVYVSFCTRSHNKIGRRMMAEANGGTPADRLRLSVYLVVRKAEDALTFYEKAFGFSPRTKCPVRTARSGTPR